MAKLKEVEVLIQFPNPTEEQMKHLFNAQKELNKAGVSFDTGSGCDGRDWEFDWSLKGARVIFRKFKSK